MQAREGENLSESAEIAPISPTNGAAGGEAWEDRRAPLFRNYLVNISGGAEADSEALTAMIYLLPCFLLSCNTHSHATPDSYLFDPSPRSSASTQRSRNALITLS